MQKFLPLFILRKIVEILLGRKLHQMNFVRLFNMIFYITRFGRPDAE